MNNVSSRSLCAPYYEVNEINDGEKNLMYYIEGSWSTGLCCDRYFKVYNLEGEMVGHIKKPWAGCWNECCCDANNTEIEVPAEMVRNSVMVVKVERHSSCKRFQ